jgi:hypothetical protein
MRSQCWQFDEQIALEKVKTSTPPFTAKMYSPWGVFEKPGQWTVYNGQWTVDDCITVHPPPESCTGIISDLAYGSLLWGQPRIFGPSRQLNWRLTDCIERWAIFRLLRNGSSQLGKSRCPCKPSVVFWFVADFGTSVKICQKASSLRDANFGRSR